ncbi:hypothetical protein C0J52_17317 [Blattella germanica]|nr:hypothetical protein C0J52_17317 [Blattella germanica]
MQQCVTSFSFVSGAHGLQLLLLEVPATADILSPVTLRCEYHLQGGKLYSVKWYKDGAEFFRFMPDYVPESRAVKSSGLSVDNNIIETAVTWYSFCILSLFAQLQNSDMNMVTLTNLRFNNSGNYKCEVSTEAPNFETVAQSSNMTVMGK